MGECIVAKPVYLAEESAGASDKQRLPTVQLVHARQLQRLHDLPKNVSEYYDSTKFLSLKVGGSTWLVKGESKLRPGRSNFCAVSCFCNATILSCSKISRL